MRRILLFATIFLCSFYYLEAQYTVNETFDGTGTPVGWTYASFARTTTVPCAGAGALRRNFWSSGAAGNIQSPSQNSNGQDLTISFKYKILQYSSGTPTVATPNTPDWGDLFVEVSTDGGTTYPIAAGTINNTNHTVSTSCATASYVVPGASVPNGNSLRIRLRGVWQTGSGTDYFFYIDDFSATQPSVTPPSCATAPAPTDAATDQSLSTQLSWASTAGATSYDVYFGTSATPPFVGNVTTTSYNPGALSATTTYYWQVIPKNANGDATGCSIWSFTTLTPLPGDNCSNAIDLATLMSPFSGTTVGYADDISVCRTGFPDRIFYIDVPNNHSITIGETTNNYDEYEYVGWGPTCPGTNTINCWDNDVLAQTNWSNTTGSTQRVWYVQDAWSGSGTFTLQWTVVPLPAVPNCATNLTSPTNGATAVVRNTPLTWTAPTGGGTPTGYKVYLGTSPNPALVTTVTGLTYTPAGQAFNTTYYWRIVPTNATGDAVGCTTEFSYTTEMVPVGTVCGNPIVVGALPYTTSDNTSAYGDDYSGSPGSSCGSTSSYLNGDDVVYSYTPSSNASVNFDLTNIGSTYAGMFIYADCADIGSTCLDGDTNGFSTADLSISDFMVTGGETYYIVISTWASPQNTTYTLNITENSCLNPSATYTVVEDCATSGGFFIDVNVTSLGSATDVTVSDGSASQSTSTTGIVTMGPYNIGTNVTITVTNEQDGTCSISSGTLTQLSCPPANNDCSNAIAIPVTLDGTCSNQILGTNVGATASGETPTPNCGSFGSGIDNWYSVTVPASGEVTIEMQSAGGPTDWVMQVYTGSCGSLVAVECDDDDGVGNFPLVNLTGRTPGEELLVRVFEWQNNATGSFNICAHSTPECGANSVYLETANGTYTLDDPCDDGNGWTYYSDPNQAGNYMFAIQWDPNNTGANVAAKANATVSVNVQGMISATNGSISASYGMGRYWNVNLNGSSMNGLVNVKFFYDPLEKTAVETASAAFATTNGVPNNGFSWFKTQSTAFTPGDITADDFQSSMVLLTEDGSGVENGVTYVQFNDISSFSGGTGATGAGAGFLPVELMAFRGNVMDAGNKLSWETATEQNAARFVIERSADGHARWLDLGSVAATGNAQVTQQYNFMDDKPLMSAYYRLRMIDQDNSFSYSPIIQLQRNNKDATITVFPVPAQDEIQVSFFLTQTGPVTLSLFDLTGKLVSKTSSNFTVGQQKERLDVSTLASGVYLLNVEIDGQRYVERVIKQ